MPSRRTPACEPKSATFESSSSAKIVSRLNTLSGSQSLSLFCLNKRIRILCYFFLSMIHTHPFHHIRPIFHHKIAIKSAIKLNFYQHCKSNHFKVSLTPLTLHAIADASKIIFFHVQLNNASELKIIREWKRREIKKKNIKWSEGNFFMLSLEARTKFMWLFSTRLV